MSTINKKESNNKLSVLHICSDFTNQHVYKELVKHLSEKGLCQVVYSSVRSELEAKWTTPELNHIEHYFRPILRPLHRLLFRAKISKAYSDLCTVVELSNVCLIHAHFLYSDGAVALKIKKRHGIPYIVAVRNTDINIFMRYRPDLFRIRNEILSEASQVVFISPAYRALLSQRITKSLHTQVDRKSTVVPNGVEASWLRMFSTPSPKSGGMLRLLYVGDFSKNKNIPGLLQAVFMLSNKRPVHLTLVGGEGDEATKVLRILASDKYKFAEYLGRITDKEHLQAIYRQHDIFVMPSFKETFGVVYIEALSQGLPIIHSHYQGVDGYFEEGTVSEAVDPTDPVDIARKIEVLAARCHIIRRDCIEQAKRFDWVRIADTYKLLYQSSIINDY